MKEQIYGGTYTRRGHIHGGDIRWTEQTYGRDITRRGRTRRGHTRRGHTIEGTNIQRDINMRNVQRGGVYLQSNVYTVETHIRTT